MSTVEHWKTAWRRGMDEARQSALAAAEERDALESKMAAQVASQAIAEREVIALQASVPPDRVAPESYAMGFRAGLECAAQAEPENPTPPGGLATLSYSIGFAKGIDVMRNAILALSAPAQGEK